MKQTTDTQIRLDWNTHAAPSIGGAPRHALPEYRYAGPEPSHWNGQRCEVLQEQIEGADTRSVVFACGCAARVPRACIRHA